MYKYMYINAESAVTANANTSLSGCYCIDTVVHLAFVDFNAHFDTNEAIERHQIRSVCVCVFLWGTIYTLQDDFKKILHGALGTYLLKWIPYDYFKW